VSQKIVQTIVESQCNLANWIWRGTALNIAQERFERKHPVAVSQPAHKALEIADRHIWPPYAVQHDDTPYMLTLRKPNRQPCVVGDALHRLCQQGFELGHMGSFSHGLALIHPLKWRLRMHFLFEAHPARYRRSPSTSQKACTPLRRQFFATLRPRVENTVTRLLGIVEIVLRGTSIRAGCVMTSALHHPSAARPRPPVRRRLHSRRLVQLCLPSARDRRGVVFMHGQASDNPKPSQPIANDRFQEI